MTLSRRRFLASTAAGLGLTALRAPRPAAAAPTVVRFAGWAFEPQVVEANAKRFMEQYPDIKVEYTPLDLQLYNEKMVALFNAGTQPDCYYVRDINLGAWVEAGWMQPIDGLPGLAELDKDIFPFNLEALKYKGKQYGTPYYGDIYVYMYDRKAAQKAGVDKPPTTLEALKQAALAVKKSEKVEYPILKGFKTNVDGLDEFWSMVFASGGNLFDEELNPVFPGQGQDRRSACSSGWSRRCTTGRSSIRRARARRDAGARRLRQRPGLLHVERRQRAAPRQQPEAQQAGRRHQPDPLPGLTDTGKGPMGWTRLYCIDAKTKVKDAAWQLIAYMGGKDKTGVYYTAKDWYTQVRCGLRLHVAGQGRRHDQGAQGGRLGPGRAEPAVRDRARPDQRQGALVQRVGPLHPAADPERAPEEGQPARRADRLGQEGRRSEEAVGLTAA